MVVKTITVVCDRCRSYGVYLWGTIIIEVFVFNDCSTSDHLIEI